MKTHEEMHEMTVSDLTTYISEVYDHANDAMAVRDYRKRIGEPRLLEAPTEVEFEEEESE
tara:strand:+ start:2280 stop:2459 length:180 start_codon:yes stop_codon:yes gene_type:complete